MTQPAPMERTQERTQKRGAFAALGVAGAFVALIAYFVIFSGSPNAGKGPGAIPRPAGEARVPLGQGSPDGQILAAKRVRFDLTDKKDPTRRTGLVLFAAMDPLEGHKYSVEKPEAWLYLSGGRSVYIRADSGLVYSPDRQKEPESGTITGNVEIKLFEAGVDVQSIDPAKTAALVVMKTDSLAFEAALGELSTEDHFSVVWRGGTFEGAGLSLVFNQPQERLERGEVRQSGRLTITRVAEARPVASKAVAPVSPGPAKGDAGVPAVAKIPVETLYRLIASDSVVATQLQRVLKADRLEVMARLRDNQLPEGAIPEIRFARRPTDPAPSAVQSSSAAPTAQGSGVAAPEVLVAEGGGDNLVLAWKGPCIITPLATTPPELKDNHVAARFSATGDGLVTLADGERGIDGHAASIEYGATNQLLSLIGTTPASVLLAVPESGRILTGRIDADLARGIIRTPGSGTLRSGRSGGGAQEQNLAWGERGEFAFQTTDDGLTGLLKEATVFGDVRGEGRELKFTSHVASATFAPAKVDQKQAVLASIDLSGDAQAQSEDTGRMTAQKLHVEFDPPPVTGGDARPRLVRAEEAFVVERAGQRLSGDSLESTLIDVGAGKLDVGSVLARGGVKFRSEKDFISGRTEELRADLGFDDAGQRQQLVSLVGAGTFLSRDEPGREQGKVNGMQMSIDGVRGRLEVFGVGDFWYRGQGETTTSSIDASWTRRMVFDDAAGLIDCWGGSLVEYSPDANTRNKADADRVKLFITPGTPGKSILSTGLGGAGQGVGQAEGRSKERAILAAEVHGSILDREGGANARIESRTYADGDKGLQKLSYLEGPSILANNETGKIDVPGAGKFLLMDQTAAAPPSGIPGARDLGGDARGVSLFEWATSLHVEKVPSGDTTMLMKDGVSIVHRALKDGQVTEIRCAEVLANLKEQAGSLGTPGRGLELQSVLATGGVYAASGPPKTEQQPRPPLRELIAQRLDYDAILRRIEARAEPGGVVTMFEPAAASPTTAQWLTWDVEKNTVQVRQPAGVAPR